MRGGDALSHKISIDWFEFVVVVVVVVEFLFIAVVVVWQMRGETVVAVVETGNSSPKEINFHYQIIQILGNNQETY